MQSTPTSLESYTGTQTNMLRWNYDIGQRAESSPAIGTQGATDCGSLDGKLDASGD